MFFIAGSGLSATGARSSIFSSLRPASSNARMLISNVRKNGGLAPGRLYLVVRALRMLVNFVAGSAGISPNSGCGVFRASSRILRFLLDDWPRKRNDSYLPLRDCVIAFHL